MHAVIVDRLEEYLADTLEPAGRREIEAHLAACRSCREEIAEVREVSEMFGSLRSEAEAPEPLPGFYASVMQRVEERRSAPVFAGWFALDLGLGRRLVFTSLMTLAVLGTYLVTREEAYSPAPTAEAMMAQEYSPSFDSAPAPDQMLVTLAAYEH
ncbi:MAG TPA: zf-HC2 domain-containing protein [Bryobacteraceae bacterium]|nr:zf-HC2 domain-containing protein [Bryobacteraceae bacterium]